MSSIPGYTLEDWLEKEYWLTVLDDECAIGIWPGQWLRHAKPVQFQELVNLFEPHREYVEDMLLDFDEENPG